MAAVVVVVVAAVAAVLLERRSSWAADSQGPVCFVLARLLRAGRMHASVCAGAPSRTQIFRTPNEQLGSSGAGQPTAFLQQPSCLSTPILAQATHPPPTSQPPSLPARSPMPPSRRRDANQQAQLRQVASSGQSHYHRWARQSVLRLCRACPTPFTG